MLTSLTSYAKQKIGLFPNKKKVLLIQLSQIIVFNISLLVIKKKNKIK